MTSVGGAHILVGTSEHTRSVNIIYVLVAVGTGETVGIHDHVPTENVFIVGTVKIHAGDHDIGNIGMRGADLFVHLSYK